MARALLLLLLCCVAAASREPNIKGPAASFLHITDMHFDSLYKAGGSTKLACHSVPRLKMKRMDHSHDKLAGGVFGARKRCDTPFALVESTVRTLKHMATAAKKKQAWRFVLWTGDTGRHDNDPSHKKSLNRSRLELFNVTKLMLGLAGSTSPAMLVIPSIGVMDVVPTGQLGPAPHPQLKQLSGVWSGLLTANGDSRALNDFLDGGYYYKQVDKTLRVVALNTLYFSKINKQVKDCSDGGSPGARQLVWLHKTLAQSRFNKMKVYISGNVPPGAQYFPGCLARYQQVAADFQDVILGHFFGHYHSDEIALLYHTTTPRPHKPHNSKKVDKARGAMARPQRKCVGVALCAPSIWPVYNPSFRSVVYSLKSYQPLGYTQYFADLDHANELDAVAFQEEYNTWHAYNMSDLSASSWLHLLDTMEHDINVMRLVDQFKYVSSRGTVPTVSPTVAPTVPTAPAPTPEQPRVLFFYDGLRHRYRAQTPLHNPVPE